MCTLNLDDHDNFIIRHPCITRPIGDAKPIRAESSADTTRTGRRIFCELYGALRLFTSIDHRDNDAPCPGVQLPLEPFDATGRESYYMGIGSCDGGCRDHNMHKSGDLRVMVHVL